MDGVSGCWIALKTGLPRPPVLSRVLSGAERTRTDIVIVEELRSLRVREPAAVAEPGVEKGYVHTLGV